MEFLLLPIPVLLIGVWIWALADIASHDDEAWRTVGESKTVWFLLVTVLQFFGTVAYLVGTRPKLMRAQETH